VEGRFLTAHRPFGGSVRRRAHLEYRFVARRHRAAGERVTQRAPGWLRTVLFGAR
jgi:hypothetical protein